MSRLSRALLALASVLLLGVLVTPIWKIHLVAPQYPEGLGMEIRAHTVRGVGEHDLDNINELNHYIGMKRIEADAIPELRIIPKVVMVLAIAGLIVAAVGRRWLAWTWFGAFAVSAIGGFVDFWKWTYEYGHELDLEHAIIKVPGMTYQPPLIGTKQLLNFEAASWPALGGILAGVAFALALAALLIRPRGERRGRRRVASVLASATAALLFIAAPARADVIVVRAGESIAAAVGRASAGDTIRLTTGVYRQPTLAIDKSLTVIGETGAILDGEGSRGLIVVNAPGVTIRALTFRNVGTSMVEDRAALRASAVRDCAFTDNRFEDAFFGIYLANVTDCLIEGNTFVAHGRSESAAGNGIHLWTSRRIRIIDNHISGHRDGIYFEFVHETEARGNVSEGNLRYGMHFMYSDDCRYVRNVFRRNGSGVAVMYTKRVEMVGNRFEHNWGAASYGLLLKEIADSRLTDNVFDHNTTGLLSDGSTRLHAEGNQLVANGWALRLEANTQEGVFLRNDFVGNTFDVATNSQGTRATFAGNYWSEARGYDLDRDGVSDVPFHPVRLFSLVADGNQASLLLLRSAFAHILDAAERAVPSLTPRGVVDAAPAMRRNR